MCYIAVFMYRQISIIFKNVITYITAFSFFCFFFLDYWGRFRYCRKYLTNGTLLSKVDSIRDFLGGLGNVFYNNLKLAFRYEIPQDSLLVTICSIYFLTDFKNQRLFSHKSILNPEWMLNNGKIMRFMNNYNNNSLL